MIDAFEAGKVQRATKIHLQLFNLFRALFATTNPIPIKAALNLLGWKVGTTRPPLCHSSIEVTEKLSAEMGKLGLL